MAESMLLVGKLAFGVVGLATGIRLSQMARSGEGLGIHALAAAIIFVGGIGLACASIGPLLAASAPALAIALEIGGDGLERIALVGLCVFVWRVFRPESTGALAATAGCGAALLASLVFEIRSQPWPSYDAALPSAWSTQLTFALPFAWSASETGVAWSRARKKQALGLADSVAVERFAIWCLACAGFVGICALAVLVTVSHVSGQEGLADVLIAARASLYFAVAASIALGMFPPAAYMRWRHGAPGA